MPMSRASREATGPMCSLAAGYRSTWCTQNRKGSSVTHGNPSDSVRMTGSSMAVPPRSSV